MRGGARIAVVVPARDEEKLIARTIRAVPPFVDDVLVVDDGSTDATVARVMDEADDRVRIVRHDRALGVGAAIARGHSEAFAQGADVVVVMAGDAQMDAADLPALLAPVLSGTADYAKGNRLDYPGVRRLMPAARWLGNVLLTRLTRIVLGVVTHDSQCGYTAMHRRAGALLDWGGLWPGYGYPNDLLAALADTGARIEDVVVRPIYAGERSGVRLRHALVVVPWVLARAWLRRAARRLSGPRALPAGVNDAAE